MDKQKQIEEMAKIIGWSCDGKSTDYCEKVDDCDECRAIDLYNAGYRKIPENAVVLTSEEYDELKQAKILLEFREETIKYLEEANIRYAEELKNKGKETAEKYHDMINEAIVNMKWARDDTHIKLVTQEACLLTNNEICKEIIEGEIQ